MADSSVIDPQAIAELRSLNPGDNDEFLREIAAIFLDDTPQRIAELDHSLAAGDLPTFARAAHSIKGSSSNLGAVTLRAAAEALEHQVRGEGLAGAAPGIANVKLEFNRARTELTLLLAQ